MNKRISSIRGMRDILPAETPLWQWLETCVRRVLQSYGYAEIRMPLLEHTELFKRSIGEVTDIVEKEMYTFADRNGDMLTLRPEGTAGCVRAAEEHGLLFNQVQRFWYGGPMFRHERPQAGRYRQFHQIGAEAFGLSGPDIDAELILLTARVMRELGLIRHVTLELNSLGDGDDRDRYRQALVDYLRPHSDALDEDSRRRLTRNPLRILDSKVPSTQQILADAPQFDDYLGEDARHHFEGVCALLDDAGLAYRLNPALVRGLDYYGRTVFEWTTAALGAQGTVCAGGRYDGLVAQMGGRATPAVGFAMGLERLVLLLEQEPVQLPSGVDVYVLAAGDASGVLLSEELRNRLPDWRILCHCGPASLKAGLKRADRSGARFAVMLGMQGQPADEVVIKELDCGEQQSVPRCELVDALLARSQAAG